MIRRATSRWSFVKRLWWLVSSQLWSKQSYLAIVILNRHSNTEFDVGKGKLVVKGSKKTVGFLLALPNWSCFAPWQPELFCANRYDNILSSRFEHLYRVPYNSTTFPCSHSKLAVCISRVQKFSILPRRVVEKVKKGEAKHMVAPLTELGGGASLTPSLLPHTTQVKLPIACRIK